jgi:hypothetical protein
MHKKSGKTFIKPNMTPSTNVHQWIRSSSNISSPLEKQFIYSKPRMNGSVKRSSAIDVQALNNSSLRMSEGALPQISEKYGY